ncbi:hypothetical protein [Limnoglobus roseus]|uniref:Uncharacterized protein n=1 Tax=Limnoglobus roseus TaxID=2598579 RepID=A0A5C1AIM6_9BACT|nr:hypothetical protein [Limnoglobus roseus]QEL18505.1 hypothetical protein PX52LOC_05531 [Limnoglobus roseus]
MTTPRIGARVVWIDTRFGQRSGEILRSERVGDRTACWLRPSDGIDPEVCLVWTDELRPAEGGAA